MRKDCFGATPKLGRSGEQMGNRRAVRLLYCAIFIAFSLSVTARTEAASENEKLLTGTTAMGDWTGDAPGVRRRITVNGLVPWRAGRSASGFAMPLFQVCRESFHFLLLLCGSYFLVGHS
jgi:hypothetical protein